MDSCEIRLAESAVQEIRSLPGEPIASHGRRPRKTIEGATLAQGEALGRR